MAAPACRQRPGLPATGAPGDVLRGCGGLPPKACDFRSGCSGGWLHGEAANAFGLALFGGFAGDAGRAFTASAA